MMKRAFTTITSPVEDWKLLREMWRNGQPAVASKVIQPVPPIVPSIQDYKNAIDNAKLYNRGFIGYLNGRAIKTNFQTYPKINSEIYNKYYGANKLENCINNLKSTKS